MKKLINDPGSVVAETLDGLLALHPGSVRRLDPHHVLARADAPLADRVAIVSGGGSGHEPAHAGYVGPGMLTAAVCGEVFTSPSVASVHAAIRGVAGPAGCLLVVKNYTGDRLNFGLAAELARIGGIPVEVVLVADDVALAAGDHAGRRGLAGTVLVHKVAGAAAEAGLPLVEVAAEAHSAAGAVRTMGVALSGCTTPASGRPGFELGPDEVELGLGIHGEPGVGRSPLETAEMLVNRLVAAILVDAGLGAGDRVALLVNGLGATPPMELTIAARSALLGLSSQGLVVERAYVGNFMTALDMAGISISVMAVDDDRLARLDAPTRAPGWPAPWAVGRPGPSIPDRPSPGPEAAAATGRPPATPLDRAVADGLDAALGACEASAEALDGLDRLVGDGDLGTSLARGARAVRARWSGLPLDDPAATLHSMAMTLQDAMGGTSGPLYAVFLVRVAERLGVGPMTDWAAWVEGLESGLDGIRDLGGATMGDRTFLDALAPAVESLGRALRERRPLPDALRDAARAARRGADESSLLFPRRGRSSYLGDRALGTVDPGAEAVARWVRAVADRLHPDHGTNPRGDGAGFRRRSH